MFYFILNESKLTQFSMKFSQFKWISVMVWLKMVFFSGIFDQTPLVLLTFSGGSQRSIVFTVLQLFCACFFSHNFIFWTGISAERVKSVSIDSSMNSFNCHLKISNISWETRCIRSYFENLFLVDLQLISVQRMSLSTWNKN